MFLQVDKMIDDYESGSKTHPKSYLFYWDLYAAPNQKWALGSRLFISSRLKMTKSTLQEMQSVLKRDGR